MSVAARIAIVALAFVFIGGIAGFRVRPGDSYRQVPAVAWLTTLGILLLGFAMTPPSACGKTQCDTGYGIGSMFLSIPIFGLTLLGVALGRLPGGPEPTTLSMRSASQLPFGQVVC